MGGRVWFGSCAGGRSNQLSYGYHWRNDQCLLTGVSGGELKVGMGSSVESADAPVSPLNSAPRPLDFRRGRGMCGCDVQLTGAFGELTVRSFIY
jgi:hypothetical protein